MPNSQKDLYKKLYGKLGENLACKFLKSQGYKILERNYRTKTAEADIIAQKDGTLTFVEVKSRSSFAFGTPAEAVTYDKQKKYRELASYYLQTNGLDGVEISFAVAEVVGKKVNVIFNAF